MTSGERHLSSEAQRWDGETGEKWVRNADLLDGMLAPFSDALLEAIGASSFECPLDIGSGAGSLTLKLARRSPGTTGLDVSSPLITLARRRAEDARSPARFVLADAAEYAPDTKHDLLVSRFGVMFFEDSVTAFSQLRRAALSGAPMHFVCWREPKRNPWASLPARIAREDLGLELRTPDPEAPGPFAFAMEDRLRGILSDAGWRSVAIEPLVKMIAIPGNNAREAAGFLVELGPLARPLEEAGVPREALIDKLCEALPEGQNGKISLLGEAWFVSAKA
ncbi:class I SAM-dependent methyltransferase [Parvularcula lutaonensis]|nr:class I SAM-dependent methyltransferase [Parvularcula lutaonensis]GGY49316.1 methyltransferase [Parvularcula lutaonensis]